MVYLPTFTPKTTPNVGKQTVYFRNNTKNLDLLDQDDLLGGSLNEDLCWDSYLPNVWGMESIVTCATTSKIYSLISLMATFGAARPSHTFSTFTSTGVASSRRGPISRGAFKARTANSLRSTTKRSLQLYRPVHHLGPSRSSTTTSLIFHLFFSYCWGWTFVACQSRDLFMSLEWMNAAKDNASVSVIFIYEWWNMIQVYRP